MPYLSPFHVDQSNKIVQNNQWFCITTHELVEPQQEDLNEGQEMRNGIIQKDGKTYACPGSCYHPYNRNRFPD